MNWIRFFHNWLLIGAVTLSTSAQAVGSYASCTTAQITLSFDDRDGLFDGMSQRGTLLTLRNVGHHTCKVKALPSLHFEGHSQDGNQITAERLIPPGMHPGPVSLPLTVAPGAELTSKLHWVSSDNYEGHNCISTETAVLTLPGGELRLLFDQQMCTQTGSKQFFDQSPLTDKKKDK